MSMTSRFPTVELVGHLSESALAGALGALTLPPEKGPVIIDCRQMTGYELGARHAFVAWSREHAHLVSRVAIVTDNRVWWMVIGAMSLASGRQMKGFATLDEAVSWVSLDRAG